MPIVFLFSAIVSGIAAVMLLYMVVAGCGKVAVDMACLDTIARYLFYAFVIDFSLEMLDLIHRIYEADESFRALDFMVKTRLFTSQIVLQIVARHARAAGAAGARPGGPALRDARRRWIYVVAGVADAGRHLRDAVERRHRRPALLEELPRLHHLQDGFATREGLLPAIVLMILPFCILDVLVRLLPPWTDTTEAAQH